MSITAAEAQELIREEIGSNDIPEIERRIAQYWSLHESKSSNVEVVMLYTKLSVLTMLMGKLKDLVDTTAGTDSFKYSQKLRNYQSLFSIEFGKLKVLDPTVTLGNFGSTATESTLPDVTEEFVDMRNHYYSGYPKGRCYPRRWGW